MKLSTLKPAAGATHARKRIGRGQGSGHGGTSTRGHKGQKSVSGFSNKAGFEGGQMPLQRRVPKFGFRNINRVEYKVINLDTLQEFSVKYPGEEINHAFLVKHGVISGERKLVKVLGRGEVTSSVSVKLNKFSETAKAAIEAAGGSVQEA
ncbi:MAG: 50S ribosomal protein L15 [Bacteroidia bacterium]